MKLVYRGVSVSFINTTRSHKVVLLDSVSCELICCVDHGSI
jgi:hypothetical protein